MKEQLEIKRMLINSKSEFPIIEEFGLYKISVENLYLTYFSKNSLELYKIYKKRLDFIKKFDKAIMEGLEETVEELHKIKNEKINIYSFPFEDWEVIIFSNTSSKIISIIRTKR